MTIQEERNMYKQQCEEQARCIKQLSECMKKLEQKNKELKQKLEETEQQLAYECGCNAELVDTQNQNKELKEIIKENFGINNVGVFFKYDAPVMEEEIKKVLNK